MNKGKIQLSRKSGEFMAAYCAIWQQLPELNNHLHWLHPEELSYYQTLKFDRRKTSYLLGRIAAKQAVATYENKPVPLQTIGILPGVFQFPVVKYPEGENIQVTLSHSDQAGVALAFPEEHPLGVDIEQLDESKVDTLRNITEPDEYQLTLNCGLTDAVGYMMLWTVKESLSKILKTGLTVDFKALEVEKMQKEGHTFVSTFKLFSQYKAVSRQVGGYLCSVAMPKYTNANLTSFWEGLEPVAKLL